jgi:hypothetical protein
LLAHCEQGNKRFGRVEFTISAPVTEAFKKEVRTIPDAAWKPLVIFRIILTN